MTIMKDKQRNILIINDDENLCSILKELLQEYGIKVDSRLDGNSGLVAYRKNKYDLVFLDFHIPPGKDGYNLLTALREVNDTTPIIMLTIELGSEIEDNCIRLGASEWVYLPFDWSEIKLVLNKYLKINE
jgi:DNA-binding response OmpR family regulator